MTRTKQMLIRTTAAIAALLLSTTTAQADNEGVTVVATGTVYSPPDRIEMAVTVNGSAELAGEAATKYRGQKERLNEALKTLGVEGLTTRNGKVNVGGQSKMQRNQYGQMVPSGSGGSFNLTETVIIELPASENTLDTVTKIYDVGKDLGIAFVNPPTGGGSLVGAKFLKSEEAEAAAYEDAMGKARKKAESLAKLSGRELGEVLSVSASNVQVQTPQQSHSSPYQQVIINGMVTYQQPTATATDEGADASLTQQKTSVSLTVRFELK